MKKYKYLGDHEVNLPKLGITAKKGEIVESDTPINHPDFQEVTSANEEEVEKQDNKKLIKL